ncbi:hypothetical protein VKT23_009974 [Stygiomarasmius scandens]
MHRCPYPGCGFENLQKSNVETHIRTHTKSKTNCCPDCDFTTVDPGSLTRHRKRIHGYIPKPRQPRRPKAQEGVFMSTSTDYPTYSRAESEAEESEYSQPEASTSYFRS